MPLSTKKSTFDALMLELRRFIAGVILFNQRVADRVGMNPTDMQCIHLLQLMGPLTPSKLAECTRLSTGGVTVVLDRLERAGLVRRERNPEDRRSVVVHLEPSTMAQIEEHYAGIEAQTTALFAACPERDLKTVLAFFTRMNEIGGIADGTTKSASARRKAPKRTKK